MAGQPDRASGECQIRDRGDEITGADRALIGRLGRGTRAKSVTAEKLVPGAKRHVRAVRWEQANIMAAGRPDMGRSRSRAHWEHAIHFEILRNVSPQQPDLVVDFVAPRGCPRREAEGAR
jgi:hypothetical protein